MFLQRSEKEVLKADISVSLAQQAHHHGTVVFFLDFGTKSVARCGQVLLMKAVCCSSFAPPSSHHGQRKEELFFFQAAVSFASVRPDRFTLQQSVVFTSQATTKGLKTKVLQVKHETHVSCLIGR